MATRFRLAPISAALVVAAVAGCSRPSKLVSFSPQEKEAGFTVMMPGTPAEEHLDQDQTPYGPSRLHLYRTDDPEICYLIAYNHFGNAVANADPNTVLGDAQSAYVANAQGELTGSKPIRIKGNPGREFEFTIPEATVAGGGQGKARVVLVGKTLYQAIVLGKTGRFKAEEDKEVRQFLESFEPTGDAS